MIIAEHGVISAPNMAVGEPFNIGLTGLERHARHAEPGRRRQARGLTVPDTFGRPAAQPARL